MKASTHNGIRFTALKGSVALAMLTVLASTDLQIAIAQTYTISDLGTLGGIDSGAIDINNFGQVVGTSTDGQSYTLQYCNNGGDFGPHSPWNCSDLGFNRYRAFLWTPTRPNGTRGAMTDLGTLGGPNGEAISLNDAGQIVGRSNPRHIYTYGGRNSGFSHQYYEAHGFLWTPSQPNAADGSISDLGDFIPRAVNFFSQMVGGSFLWQNRTLTDLGSLGGGSTFAHSINDLGQVVGDSLIIANGPSHAFLWQNGVMRDLGTLPGQTNSTASSINRNREVVGTCYNDGSSTRGFLFRLDSSGTVTARTDLGTFYPLHINNLGQAVGFSVSNGVWKPALWDSVHEIRDLNSLLPTGSGWVLQYAGAINDAGQIVGTGTNSAGQVHAFLLTPLPVPRLTLASIQLDGQFGFTLVGEAERSYTIEASTNLVNWIAVTNFVSATGTNQFTAAAAPNFSRRFYRAVSP